MTTETISTAVTTARTPAWDRLNQQQKAFLTIYLATKDHIRAAREANYPVKRASVLMKSPRIRAALAEAQPVAEVRIQAEQADVIAASEDLIPTHSPVRPCIEEHLLLRPDRVLPFDPIGAELDLEPRTPYVCVRRVAADDTL